jgi:hypothetical protein
MTRFTSCNAKPEKTGKSLTGSYKKKGGKAMHDDEKSVSSQKSGVMTHEPTNNVISKI